jgi:glycosyltransferase involved in cell wall biosynthesis
MSTVTVIIPTYDRREMVCEAVRSAQAQLYGDLTILVIDDGSTDGTDRACLQFGSNVRYHWQPNYGEASARNQGIRLAASPYVAFLDSDDQWHPAFLKTVMEEFERDPHLALVSTGCVESPRNKHRPGRAPSRLSGDLFVTLFSRNIVTTSAVVLKRSCFDRVGFFDERLKQAEDYDMWLRIARVLPVAFINQPLCHWRRHSGNLSANDIQHRTSVLRVIENHGGDQRISAKLYASRRSSLLVSLGRAYLRGKQLMKAHECFHEALKLTPHRLRPLLYAFYTCVKRLCTPASSQHC